MKEESTRFSFNASLLNTTRKGRGQDISNRSVFHKPFSMSPEAREPPARRVKPKVRKGLAKKASRLDSASLFNTTVLPEIRGSAV